MQRQRRSWTRAGAIWGAAVALAWLAGGCDVHLHDDDDQDSDLTWVKVEAKLGVVVRDYDTYLAVYGAKVSFYLDSGDEDHLSFDEDRPFAIGYTDADGAASLTARAWLNNPDECIGIKAVAEYADWTAATTGVVKFFYPDGGTRTTTLYLDRRPSWWAAVPPSDTGRSFAVPDSDYPTIQSAIAAARAGDRIAVAPGRYAENLDFLGKDLAVVATDGPDVTILDGGPADGAPAVSFVSGEGPAALLCGFTVVGGAVGVRVAGANPTLAANVIVSGLASPDPAALARLEWQERALDNLLADGLALAALARTPPALARTPPMPAERHTAAAVPRPAPAPGRFRLAAWAAGGAALVFLSLLGAVTLGRRRSGA